MDKSSFENVINEINTEDILREKLEEKISAEIDRRIAEGMNQEYIEMEVKRRMQSDEVKKIIQVKVEEKVKEKLNEEINEQVIEDVDEILYTRENGETINERGIDIGLRQGREEGIEIGRESGYEKGLEEADEYNYQKGLKEGRKQGLERVARTMYKDNYPLPEITKLTGLVLRNPPKKWKIEHYYIKSIFLNTIIIENYEIYNT